MPAGLAALLALVMACGVSRGVGASATEHVPVATATPLATSGAMPAEPATPPNRGATLPRTTERIWNFDADAVDAAPAGFTFVCAGTGSPGRWVVTKDPSAPSGTMVLGQVDADSTPDRCPVALENPMSIPDVHLSLRCKIVSGSLDQTCGLVARYRNPQNYFVTRASARDNSISLSIVQDGQLQQLARWQGEVTPKVWHSYRFELRGLHLEVFWDDEQVIDYRGAFTDAGRVGVETKADSIAYFDDLRAEHF